MNFNWHYRNAFAIGLKSYLKVTCEGNSSFVLCIYLIQVSAHTLGLLSHEHTHTVNCGRTHTEQRAVIFAVVPEERLGVMGLTQGPATFRLPV